MSGGIYVVAAALSAEITWRISAHHHVGPVRASALTTLFGLGLLRWTGFAAPPFIEAAVFGGSFVGMSDVTRLSWRGRGWASATYGLTFPYALAKCTGIGGTLGATALASCLIVYAIFSDR
jgi:hypothetical protein